MTTTTTTTTNPTQSSAAAPPLSEEDAQPQPPPPQPPHERPLRILTLGMGALGSIYSFILSRSTSPRCHVTCVARSNYETLRDGQIGITFKSDKFGVCQRWVPDVVYQDGNQEHQLESRSRSSHQQEGYDYVLCCFKAVEESVPAMSEIVRPWLAAAAEAAGGAPAAEAPTGTRNKGPRIIMIQNGIGIEDEMQRNLVDVGLARGISSGIAWIGANLRENGTVVTHGSMDRIEMGLYSGSNSSYNGMDLVDSAEQDQIIFQRAFNSGGGDLEIKKDIQPIRWSKLLWNAAWASMCSLSRQSLSTLLEPEVLPYLIGPVRRTMLEVIDVARADGIGEDRLPVEAVDKAFNITYVSRPRQEGDQREGELVSTLSDGFKPSLLLDLEAGRPMEVKGIIGNVVQLARKHGVETPRLGEE